MAACAGSQPHRFQVAGHDVGAGKVGAREHGSIATTSGYAHQLRESRLGKFRASEAWISQMGGKLEVVGSSGFHEAKIGAQSLSKTGSTIGDESPKLRLGLASCRKALAGAATLVGVSLAFCSSTLAETEVIVHTPRTEAVAALEARFQEQAHLDIQAAMRGNDVVCGVSVESGGEDGYGTAGLTMLSVSMPPPPLAPELTPLTAFNAVSGSSAIGMCVNAVATPAISSPAAAGASVSGGGQVLTRAAEHFSRGGIAGAVGAALVYPLDTIKTRMQAQKSVWDFV